MADGPRMWNVLQLLIAADRAASASRRSSLLKRRAALRAQSIQSIPASTFEATYRLTKVEFYNLCDHLLVHTSLRGTRKISLEVMVLTALSFYALGSYQRGAALSHGMDQRSVSTCISKVTTALNEPAIINTWIKFPVTVEEKDAVKRGFYNKFGFPGVLGAIDGTHINIVRPAEDEPCFFDKNRRHSLNVQMVCDSNLRFINVNAKFGGRAHDSYIWSMSQVKQHMEDLQRNEESLWLLGDSGYPQRAYLMTPIKNAARGSREEMYTNLHVKTRNIIERAFGVLKSRFRAMDKQRTLFYHPDKAAQLVMACCVLHNMLIDSRGVADVTEPNEDGNINEADGNIYEEDANLPDLLLGRALRRRLIMRLFP